MLLKSNLSLLFISFLSLSTLVTALAPGERRIPILKDEHGFYVEANLGSKTKPNPGNLVFKISGHSSFFAKDCYGFKPFDCSDCYLNYESFSLKDPTFPDHEVFEFFSKTSEASTTFWNLNRKNFKEQCSPKHFNYEQKRSGLVGMGMGLSFNNVPFDYPKAFSILVNKEQTKAALFYKAPPSSERVPLSSFKTNRNWIILGGPCQLTSPEQDKLYMDIIFDMNAKALGISNYKFNTLFKIMTKKMNCPGTEPAKFKPKCPFNGQIKDLPALEFQLESGKLSIPPEVYVDNISDGVATLNIKQVSSSGEGIHYQNWGNNDGTLILDSRFMSYFETVFDMSNRENPTVKLYSLEGTNIDDGAENKEEKESPKEDKEPAKEDNSKKNNGDREVVDRSSFSFGSFFMGLFLAVLIGGVVIAYLRFRGGDHDYSDMQNSQVKKEHLSKTNYLEEKLDRGHNNV